MTTGKTLALTIQTFVNKVIRRTWAPHERRRGVGLPYATSIELLTYRETEKEKER